MTDPAAARPRSPYRAAFLSFLWPGLGQLYAGRRRAALLFGLPVLGVTLLIVGQALSSIGQLAALLLTPTSALTVLILVVLLGAWRLLAIADAMSVGSSPGAARRPSHLAAFVVLALAVAAMHGAMGYVAWAFYDASSQIFVGGDGPDETPVPSAPIGASPGPTDEYVEEPINTPATTAERINVLLLGVDSATTRSSELTDTLLVASVDPTTGAVALISFPRDIAGFELSDGRIFRGKINSLMSWARNHPDEFPDGPLDTLVNEIGYLLGAPIHYYAAIDLAGFRKMIDLVGGVTVDNPRAINDPRYDWLDGERGFRLSAGEHHLDGRTALAYVRSRQGSGDSDFTRARRQQQVLLALRDELIAPDSLTRIPPLLEAAADTVRTNFPSERVAEMIDLAQRLETESVKQVVLGPTKYASARPPSETGGTYQLRLDLDALAALSIELFGDRSRYAQDD